jgi:hypothetical protein
VFAAQDLFYDLPLSAATVILTVISIGLFGYGICGIMRPITVWYVVCQSYSPREQTRTIQADFGTGMWTLSIGPTCPW